MKFKGFLVIISLLVFFSCDCQKRLYRKGFYVHWSPSRSDVHKQPLSCSVQENYSNSTDHKQEVVLTSSDNKDWINILNKIKNDPCGDTLVLKSGEELIVKILEISDEEIKYKKCEYLNGPTYVIKKNKIYMIKYFNGTREYIIPENVPPSADKKEYAGEGEYDYGYQLPKQNEYSSDKNNKLLPPPSILVYAFVALVAGMGIPFLPFADSLLLALANLLLIGVKFHQVVDENLA